jgi:membrane associated rhomboid family serine protease
LGEEAYKSWYLNAIFETTAIRRWLDSSLLYIASTVIFSVIGMLLYRFSRKHSRLKVLRSFAHLYIFLTLILRQDRRFALSARLLLSPRILMNAY